jgi:NAD(P)-dependent dehydrogenase (short-subunit alcohol dehydrogenase family)
MFMEIRFDNKTALVTGSTLGIGYATALELARSGAAVTINGRSQSSVDQALTSLRREAPDAAIDGVAADLATAQGCEALLAHLPAVDILVNNMGVYATQDFFEIADEEWDRFFQTNVMSGIRLARAYTPGMVDKGWGGSCLCRLNQASIFRRK